MLLFIISYMSRNKYMPKARRRQRWGLHFLLPLGLELPGRYPAVETAGKVLGAVQLNRRADATDKGRTNVSGSSTLYTWHDATAREQSGIGNAHAGGVSECSTFFGSGIPMT